MEYSCGLCLDREPFETASKLQGHFSKAHHLTVAAYIQKYPEAKSWFSSRHKSSEDKQEELPIPEEGILGALESADERKAYKDYYEQVFQQVDRDSTQIPVIEALSLDTILLKRLRLEQVKKANSKDVNAIKIRNEEIEALSKRINSYFGILGISRSDKIKNKVQVKSSVGMLIGGYFDEVERKSNEELQTLEMEERSALHEAQQRIDQWIIAPAPDLKKDDLLHEDGSPIIPDIAEIARRANISV